MQMRINTIVVLALITSVVGCGSSSSTAVDPNTIVGVLVDAPVNSISIGEGVQLSATVYTKAGATTSTASAVWTSSAPTVASIDQTGKVTGIAPGSTTITVVRAGVTGTFPLAVGANGVPFTKDTLYALAQSFSPTTLTITQNTFITFSFSGGTDHTVIFRKTNPVGSPADVQRLSSGNFQRRFTLKGTFVFDDTLRAGMSGTIVVQ